MVNIERVKHTLTLRHWRDNRKGANKIMMCSCGYKCKSVRRLDRRIFFRGMRLCFWRGHDWDDSDPVMVGPAGAPDEEFESIGLVTQCNRCWKVKVIA